MLRIEDHDRTRSRRESERALLEDLEWLGLLPDSGAFASYRAGGGNPLRQSDNDASYERAHDALEQRGLIYPCRCSRRDVGLVSGIDITTSTGREHRYPGTCRASPVGAAETSARRVRIDDGEERFDDLRLGPQRQQPATQCGDVLLRDRHGNWTYQFAVVVDDMAQAMDVVIRGEDLLPSTGRQIALARMLGRPTPPLFLHHTLVRRPDGAKLSKSTNDTSIRALREAGATSADLLGVAAHACGLQTNPRPLDVDELPALFR